MCEGSIHVKHRQVTDKEQLIVRPVPGHGGMKGTYPTKGAGKDLLVCIRKQTDAIIKTVRFEKGLPPKLEEYEGKRNVKVEFIGRYAQVRFPNGYITALYGLKEGVRVDIGIPVQPRKRNLVKVLGLDQPDATILPPDPRPEGDDADHPAPAQPAPAEPAPASEPERQPEPTARARRRR